MERNKIRHPGLRQKKNLIKFIANHPQMITCKVTEDYSIKEFQILWRELANELNALPGAKKSWKQWRKTWQDLRSRLKNRHCRAGYNGSFYDLMVELSEEEKNALGFANIPISAKRVFDNNHSASPDEDTLNFDNTDNSIESSRFSNYESSPPCSPNEPKVFVEPIEPSENPISSPLIANRPNCDTCALNYDSLTAQEAKKFELKRQYFKLKSKYLKQKIKLMKEHNEALRSIADALRRRP